MTAFLWDASHYDGLLSPGILARARSEGIVGFTHKIAEGLQDTEGRNDDTALAAARSAGIEFIGGYLIPRSNASVTAQVDRWLQLADQGEPWWRDFPGWFWQIDLERWSYDNVSASTGIAAARELRARTGRWTVLYASHGQYGDALGGWDGPLWNADYVGKPAAGFAQMYPGDGWTPSHGTWQGGWAPYSGREPTFLQYASSATIAGLSTCDANAFRGSVEQLRALVTHTTNLMQGGDMEQSEPVQAWGGKARPVQVGWVLGDLENLRDYWTSAPGDTLVAPPKPGSRADLLMQAVDKVLAGQSAAVTLSDEQLAEVAQQVSAAVIANHDALSPGDAAVIQAAVGDELAKVFGAAATAAES